MFCSVADEKVLTLQVKNGAHPHPERCQVTVPDCNTDKI